MEIKKCGQCGQDFEINQNDLDFFDKISPIFADKKHKIPVPKLCPDCRQQRRMSIRNFFNLYQRRCNSNWKKLISMFHESVEFPVYNLEDWWSDKWSALDYWIEIDFNKSFFEQWNKINKTVPKQNVISVSCENSDYSNLSYNSLNCYLVFWCVESEDCYYGHIVWHCKNCLDCFYTYRSEYCYKCVDCIDSYNVFFWRNIENCSNSKFLIDCKNCQNCFWCVGLNDKNFCFFNKQYTKEEYKEKLKDYNSWSYKQIEKINKRLSELLSNSIVKNYHWFNCENCSWDYLYNCKDIKSSYDAKFCENISYCATVWKLDNCYDVNFSPTETSFSYEWLAIFWTNILFCYDCMNNCSNLTYCDNCYWCHNCFLCSGLKNQEYCILNKKYAKEEYNKLVPKIIDNMTKDWEWWEFFSANISPFGYNESVAMEYYPVESPISFKPHPSPLLKGEGTEWIDMTIYFSPFRWNESVNFKWVNYSTPTPNVTKIIPAEKLPDTINEIPDDILNWAIKCEKTWKAFKIIPQELKFYRKHNIPIPHLHPDERRKYMMWLKNPRRLYDRRCDKCGEVIKSTYSLERSERVYCEECYEKMH